MEIAMRRCALQLGLNFINCNSSKWQNCLDRMAPLGNISSDSYSHWSQPTRLASTVRRNWAV